LFGIDTLVQDDSLLGLPLLIIRLRGGGINLKTQELPLKRFIIALTAVATLAGCNLKGSSIPGAAIPFAKADYTIMGATNAEECGTYIVGIDFVHIFKNEGAVVAPGTFTLDDVGGAIGAGATTGRLSPEGSRALYYALEKMPEATHLLAPRVNVEITGIPMGPSPYAPILFGKRCASVEAHGVKIGARPNAQQ